MIYNESLSTLPICFQEEPKSEWTNTEETPFYSTCYIYSGTL